MANQLLKVKRKQTQAEKQQMEQQKQQMDAQLKSQLQQQAAQAEIVKVRSPPVLLAEFGTPVLFLKGMSRQGPPGPAYVCPQTTV